MSNLGKTLLAPNKKTLQTNSPMYLKGHLNYHIILFSTLVNLIFFSFQKLLLKDSN